MSLYSSRISDCFEQGRCVFLAVGERPLKGAGGAADRFKGMELQQAGALRDRELCDPVQFVHVVEGEREDEAERNSAGAQALQPRAHLVERPRRIPHEIMRLGYAVEADCDQVAISLEGVQPASIEQHAVGRDGRRQSRGVRGTQQFSQRGVHQRLSARHREDPVADRSRIGDDPTQQVDIQPFRDRRPGVRNSSAGTANCSACRDAPAGWDIFPPGRPRKT